jgi:excisionase family DNA binding protein
MIPIIITISKERNRKKEMALQETYSTGEAAEILGVHIDTVRRFCDNGELVFQKGLLSTHRRIKPEALEKFMRGRGISEKIIKECRVRQTIDT